jgi:uncharacterized protein YjbI with pentapeptide repeats
MKRIALLAVMDVLIGVLSVGSAHAFDQADLNRLRTTGSCVSCDLSQAYLIGANLIGANLSQANLSEAYLTGANLRRTYLYRANLRDANLSGGANLSEAYMGGAYLYRTNLTGANLSGANLSGATWTDGSKCKEGSIGQCLK